MEITTHDLDVLKLLVKGEPRTIEDVLEIGRRVIDGSAHVSRPADGEEDAKVLLQFCLEASEIPYETTVLTKPIRDRFLSFVARRAAGEPLALITGSTSFLGLDLRVEPGVFIPREICRTVVSRAVRRLRSRPKPTALDLCTGIGAIAMAIAKDVPSADVVGSDVSAQSLRLARANAKRLAIRNVSFRRSDLYGQLPRSMLGRVDVITAYTPFVPVWEVFQLPAEAREYEPVFSFTDMSLDGTTALRAIIADAHRWLRPSGWLLLQVAAEHEAVVSGLFEEAGMRSVTTSPAVNPREVVVEGKRAA